MAFSGENRRVALQGGLHVEIDGVLTLQLRLHRHSGRYLRTTGNRGGAEGVQRFLVSGVFYRRVGTAEHELKQERQHPETQRHDTPRASMLVERMRMTIAYAVKSWVLLLLSDIRIA